MSPAEMEDLVGQPILAIILPISELLFRVNLDNEGRAVALLQGENPGIRAIFEMAQTLVK